MRRDAITMRVLERWPENRIGERITPRIEPTHGGTFCEGLMPGEKDSTIDKAQQLSLFRSRKQRGTAPPAPSEFQSQAFLVDVIRRWLDPAWKFTHIASGEYRVPCHRGTIAAARRRRRLA